MKSAKFSPPAATRTVTWEGFKIGSGASRMASASGPERLVITKAFILQSLAGGGVSVGGQIVSLLRLAKEPSHHADGWEETGRGATHAFFAGYLPSGIYFWHWLRP